jgi:hypothetical protein
MEIKERREIKRKKIKMLLANQRSINYTHHPVTANEISTLLSNNEFVN